MKHIVFDLDGTLIDSRKEIIRTYEQVFEKHKPRVKPDVEKINYGATLTYVLEGIYGDDTATREKARSLFKSLYDVSDFNETNLYPDVEETLMNLRTRAYRLHIATNKRFIPTQRILMRKGLSGYFEGVQASEGTPNSLLTKDQMLAVLKNNYGFNEGFMVGDTTTDILAGNAAKLVTIAVTYGYENKDIFASQNPNYIIDKFPEIAGIVEKHKF